MVRKRRKKGRKAQGLEEEKKAGKFIGKTAKKGSKKSEELGKKAGKKAGKLAYKSGKKAGELTKKAIWDYPEKLGYKGGRKAGKKLKEFFKSKGRGWHGDPYRHSLASHGVQTAQGIPKDIKEEWKEGDLPYINHSNYSFRVREDRDGNLRLDIGLDGFGWRWSGDETQLAGWFQRIVNSKFDLGKFIESLEDAGVEFEDLKPLIEKSVKQGNGLYMVSGDNSVWHFGQTFDEGAELHEMEGYFSSEEGMEILTELTDKDRDELFEKFEEDFWMEGYDGNHIDYDYFLENTDTKEEYIERMGYALETSDDYEQFMRTLEEEFEWENWRYGIEEWRMNAFQEEVFGYWNEWVDKQKEEEYFDYTDELQEKTGMELSPPTDYFESKTSLGEFQDAKDELEEMESLKPTTSREEKVDKISEVAPWMNKSEIRDRLTKEKPLTDFGG